MYFIFTNLNKPPQNYEFCGVFSKYIWNEREKFMAAFSYKKATTTTLKACGFVDIEKGTINIDGEDKKILSLLADFNGTEIELVAKVKDEEELDEPTSDEE